MGRAGLVESAEKQKLQVHDRNGRRSDVTFIPVGHPLNRTRGQSENNENSGYCSVGGSFDRGLAIGRDTAASPWVGCWVGSSYSGAGGTLHIGGMLQLSPSRQVSGKAGWETYTGCGNDRAQRAR